MTKLLADNAPACMKEQKLESYFGRKIAIDASMSIYQFLVRETTALERSDADIPAKRLSMANPLSHHGLVPAVLQSIALSGRGS